MQKGFSNSYDPLFISFSNRERERKRKGDKRARVSKVDRFQASRTSIPSKYLFSPLIFW